MHETDRDYVERVKDIDDLIGVSSSIALLFDFCFVLGLYQKSFSLLLISSIGLVVEIAETRIIVAAILAGCKDRFLCTMLDKDAAEQALDTALHR